jgi:ankyrin repeat protein
MLFSPLMNLASRSEAALAPSIVWLPGKVLILHQMFTPCSVASRYDRQAALLRMAEQAAVNAIFRAAREGDAGDVARRLDLQPDLLESEETSYSGSLVYQAAFKGHADVMRLLIGKGADVNRKPPWFWSPIDAAVSGGHKEVVDLLLEAGAKLRQKRHTTLMRACEKGRLGVIRRLLQHMRGEGLSLNVRDAYCGRTALMLACLREQAEVTRVLLLAGADDTIADIRGITPRQEVQRPAVHPCRAVYQVGALTYH